MCSVHSMCSPHTCQYNFLHAISEARPPPAPVEKGSTETNVPRAHKIHLMRLWLASCGFGYLHEGPAKLSAGDTVIRRLYCDRIHFHVHSGACWKVSAPLWLLAGCLSSLPCRPLHGCLHVLRIWQKALKFLR